MIDGNPEFADIVYDYIKSRYPSASKNYNKRFKDWEIFIDGQLRCTIYNNELYGHMSGKPVRPTDPQLFDKIINMCSHWANNKATHF